MPNDYIKLTVFAHVALTVRLDADTTVDRFEDAVLTAVRERLSGYDNVIKVSL